MMLTQRLEACTIYWFRLVWIAMLSRIIYEQKHLFSTLALYPWIAEKIYDASLSPHGVRHLLCKAFALY